MARRSDPWLITHPGLSFDANGSDAMTLNLPKDIEALVLARVEAGDFASAEEVLRDAMKPWLDAERARQRNLDRIRASVAIGDADLVDFSPDEVRSRLDALAAPFADRAPDAA
jgi:Arc/MetJ-type ribon-helix-helix transcriptional regulator